jgi:hypothetical protein
VVLADEDMSPEARDWIKTTSGSPISVWDRFGLEEAGCGTPVTHYLFEVLRIFCKTFDAWNETLDTIDESLNVDVSYNHK